MFEYTSRNPKLFFALRYSMDLIWTRDLSPNRQSALTINRKPYFFRCNQCYQDKTGNAAAVCTPNHFDFRKKTKILLFTPDGSLRGIVHVKRRIERDRVCRPVKGFCFCKISLSIKIIKNFNLEISKYVQYTCINNCLVIIMKFELYFLTISTFEYTYVR